MQDLFPVRVTVRSVFIYGELRVLLFYWEISWCVRPSRAHAAENPF